MGHVSCIDETLTLILVSGVPDQCRQGRPSEQVLGFRSFLIPIFEQRFEGVNESAVPKEYLTFQALPR
jgi:hypothetical protein